MPKGTTPLITALLLAGLALAGCAAAPAAGPTPDAIETTSQETPQPLVAETADADAGEAQYLAYVRENLPPTTVIPNATDEQLLTAGEKACEIRATGAATDTISVIEGEQQAESGYYNDSAVIVGGAGLFLCG